MNIGIYFNKDEVEWIKSQPEGTVRELVQSAMGEGVPTETVIKPKKVVVSKLQPKSEKREPGWCANGHWVGVGFKTCKLCSSRVY